MKVERVICYIGPDQVAEGFYSFDGTTVTMMGDDGKGNWNPFLLDDESVTESATPTTAVAIAKVLTKRIRRELRGEKVEGFGRRLEYQYEGVA